MAIDTETALLFRQDDGALADHLRFPGVSDSAPLNHQKQSVSGPSICVRVFRIVMGIILYISVISLITCAAQGCYDNTISGVDAKICDQLCPENRKVVTYAGLIVGTLGVILCYLP